MKTIFAKSEHQAPSVTIPIFMDILLLLNKQNTENQLPGLLNIKNKYNSLIGGLDFQHKFRHSKLTQRERDILKLFSKGVSSNDISDKLSISLEKVNTHRKNILLKTGYTNISQLIAIAMKNSFFESGESMDFIPGKK